jgi:uncharacterized protein YjbI with pentapeptide repeats
MENQSIDKEIEDIIQRVQKAETDNFFELAKILGRDPKKDYVGANLHQCDLSNGDLKGAILRQTDLSSANLSGTDLSGADLSGADLTNSNLSNAKLEEVIVVGTLFDKNVGLNSADVNYLQKKGAIFGNSHLRSNVTTSNSYELKSYNEPSFGGFLKYFFGGENDFLSNIYETPFIEIAAIDIVEDDQATPEIGAIERLEDEQTTKSSINFITKLFSLCLAISFLIAFGAIIYQALILGSERANIVIYHAFTLILGCFIGALTTYLRMASEQKD